MCTLRAAYVEVINRGGESIAPREIEEVLLADRAVQEVAVVGQPDPLYGEQVVAYVVTRGGWDAALEEHLRAHCAERLSAYKVPAVFIPVAELPRGYTGKIDRRLLRDARKALVVG